MRLIDAAFTRPAAPPSRTRRAAIVFNLGGAASKRRSPEVKAEWIVGQGVVKAELTDDAPPGHGPECAHGRSEPGPAAMDTGMLPASGGAAPLPEVELARDRLADPSSSTEAPSQGEGKALLGTAGNAAAPQEASAVTALLLGPAAAADASEPDCQAKATAQCSESEHHEALAGQQHDAAPTLQDCSSAGNTTGDGLRRTAGDGSEGRGAADDETAEIAAAGETESTRKGVSSEVGDEKMANADPAHNGHGHKVHARKKVWWSAPSTGSNHCTK